MCIFSLKNVYIGYSRETTQAIYTYVKTTTWASGNNTLPRLLYCPNLSQTKWPAQSTASLPLFELLWIAELMLEIIKMNVLVCTIAPFSHHITWSRFLSVMYFLPRELRNSQKKQFVHREQKARSTLSWQEEMSQNLLYNILTHKPKPTDFLMP